jgi:hypothetical protein
LWDLLSLRADLVLVTGDKRLLPDAGMQPHVVSPLIGVTRLQHLSVMDKAA